MPSNSPTTLAGGVIGTGTEATGNTTARDTADVAGSAQQTSTITAQAAATGQRLGHRRFVSRPLAAHTFAAADGNWTCSLAAFESNTNHSSGGALSMQCLVYAWRPSTGLQVGAGGPVVNINVNVTAATTETTASGTGTWSATFSILDQDILAFDVCSNFTQSMATAYTDSFAYNGTTEASTTTCASFVTPPSALTLFTAAQVIPDVMMARTRV